VRREKAGLKERNKRKGEPMIFVGGQKKAPRGVGDWQRKRMWKGCCRGGCGKRKKEDGLRILIDGGKNEG